MRKDNQSFETTQWTIKTKRIKLAKDVLFIFMHIWSLLGVKYKFNKSQTTSSVYFTFWKNPRKRYEFRITDH